MDRIMIWFVGSIRLILVEEKDVEDIEKAIGLVGP